MIKQLPRNFNSLQDDTPIKDATTTDVGTTLTASVHWFDGGYNPDIGAGAGVSASKLREMSDQLARSHEMIYFHESLLRTDLEKYDKAIEEWRVREEAPNDPNFVQDLKES
jgi:hypothetical protein